MRRRPERHASPPAPSQPHDDRGHSACEDRWLDLIADIIAQDLLDEESE
jgi:hypothetical protein